MGLRLNALVSPRFRDREKNIWILICFLTLDLALLDLKENKKFEGCQIQYFSYSITLYFKIFSFSEYSSLSIWAGCNELQMFPIALSDLRLSNMEQLETLMEDPDAEIHLSPADQQNNRFFYLPKYIIRFCFNYFFSRLLWVNARHNSVAYYMAALTQNDSRSFGFHFPSPVGLFSIRDLYKLARLLERSGDIFKTF